MEYEYNYEYNKARVITKKKMTVMTNKLEQKINKKIWVQLNTSAQKSKSFKRCRLFPIALLEESVF